jgi:malonyl-CoA/methylmalonyl-CoA synthetase
MDWWIVLPAIPIFKQLVEHARHGRTAIIDLSVAPDGEARYSYAQLLDDVAKFRDDLSAFLGTKDLQGGRVPFLVENGYNYVVTLFTIWALGGFAVPLCTTHPIHEMLYMVTDSDSIVLLATEHFESNLRELAREVAKDSPGKRALYIIPHHPPRIVSSIPELKDSPIADPKRHALMIYTSGTTGKPKVYLYAKLSDDRVSYPHIKLFKHKSIHWWNTGELLKMIE